MQESGTNTKTVQWEALDKTTPDDVQSEKAPLESRIINSSGPYPDNRAGRRKWVAEVKRDVARKKKR